MTSVRQPATRWVDVVYVGKVAHRMIHRREPNALLATTWLRRWGRRRA